MLDASTIAPLAVVLAAAVTGFVAWTVAKRTTSGSIDTSEAATLWDEGTIMRKELREQVTTLRAESADLKTQLTIAVAAVTSLNDEIRRSRQETEAAREETRLSREETRKLMSQIESLHQETKGVLIETSHVLDEVKTSNALSIGALADNTESRRILEITPSERTSQENEHLATAHDRLPDELRADQNKGKGNGHE